MRLIFVFFAVAALPWPIKMASLEGFEKELAFLKMKIEGLETNEDKMNEDIVKMRNKIENLEKNDNDLKEKIKEMETNEENMKENIFKMRNKMFDMKMNGFSIEKELETKKEIWSTNNEEMVSSEKETTNNIGKIEDREDQNGQHQATSGNIRFYRDAEMENILDGNIYGHAIDCCDDIDDIKTNIGHLNERVNDNTLKIVENQFEIDNSKKEIDTNTNNIDTNANKITTNTNNIGNLMKQSAYCASQINLGEDKQNQVITYNKLVLSNNYDIPGAQMDIKKGEFTAGVNGIYQINVSLNFGVLSMNRLSGDVYLRHNGVNVAESRMHSTTINHHDDVGGRYMFLRLETGDTVSVFAENFNGFLLDITFCVNLLK